MAATPQKPKPLDWLHNGVVIGCFIPLVMLLLGLATGRISFGLELKNILNQLGYLGLVLLLASLACTPLRLVFGFKWPSKLRKSLGLFGFFYIALHATLYWKSQNFSIVTVYNETLARTFILFGMAAFLLLIPLALTSTNSMIKRVGGKRWQMLHKLAYVIGILGIVHFYLRIKGNDHTEPLIYGGILAVLLGVRVWKKLASAK
ncbi:MAG: protein-methionine-sulfoxide reductase heme-binding subunit MsrQ [Planctomycetota bacterium]